MLSVKLYIIKVDSVMGKQYTREQIVEAIKHWESVLRRMDESVYNNIIDALIDEFGKEIVFSKEFNYILT